MQKSRSDILIELDQLSFAYDPGAPVLTGVDLQVEHDHIVGIVGPSGCGKSTLLSLIAGLEQPMSGAIRWAPAEKNRHPISMMFQRDTLLPWLTVRSNVGLHYKLVRGKSLRDPKVRDHIDRLIGLAGLTGSDEKFPYQLSGGMKRRTAFLAAVAPHPRTLLLDEPFSSLDEPTRIAIHQDIFEVIKRERITTVLVTHDLAEALSMSDIVMVMSSRPSRIEASFRIPFGQERDMLSLREQPEFLKLYGQVWEALSRQIQRSRGL
jgi:NitT/TauT family transport system ATP-binding protein